MGLSPQDSCYFLQNNCYSCPAGTLMILKSACCNNPSYIDRLISVFMRSLQKMVREHLNPQAASGSTEATAGNSLGLVFFLRGLWGSSGECRLCLNTTVNMG